MVFLYHGKWPDVKFKITSGSFQCKGISNHHHQCVSMLQTNYASLHFDEYSICTHTHARARTHTHTLHARTRTHTLHNGQYCCCGRLAIQTQHGRADLHISLETRPVLYLMYCTSTSATLTGLVYFLLAKIKHTFNSKLNYSST